MMSKKLKTQNERRMKKSSGSLSRGAAFALLAVTLALVPLGFAEETKPPAPAVSSSTAFKLSGYTHILGTIQKTGVDSLAVRRVRFTLSAEILKNLKAKVQVDVSRAPSLVDAQFDYTFSEFLALRFGQFYVPFGVESTTSTSSLDFINQAIAVEKLAPGRDVGTQGRDIGAILTGKYSIFDYNFGLFNGPGANKAETNDEKDFAGRLGIKPFDFLSVGASYYKGKYSATTGMPALRRDKNGFDVGLAFGDVTLKGEYLHAIDDKIDKNGWFVQAGWFVLPKTVQILAKYDALDVNTDLADDGLRLFTAGVNWFFSDKSKIQFNYEYLRNELSQTVNQAFLVQLQTGF
ncbi:MAG: porin [Candidatus Aminicenantales bacterium]